MLRPDISEAISLVPPHIGDQIQTSCKSSLDLVNAHLSADETVVNIASASPRGAGPTNSLLVLTDRRLLFVAPAPQAVGWSLATITRAQSHGGFFFVNGDGGEYSLGLEDGWGSEFEGHVKQAVALAVLANR